MPQPLDLVVDRGVLLDVGVGLRDVGLGLVVVVVADEVLDGIVRQHLAQLVGQLRRQGLVRRHDQRRALQPLDQPLAVPVADFPRPVRPRGPRSRWAGTEQHDVLLGSVRPATIRFSRSAIDVPPDPADEGLDDDTDDDTDETLADDRAAVMNPLVWGAVVAWVVAAVLAVAAPFRPIYTVTTTALAGASHQSLDGWGRYTGFTATALPAGSHSTRYGIAFCVAAALIVATAAAAFYAARRPDTDAPSSSVRALVVPVAAVAATVLATLTAVEYLLIDALSDSVAAQTSGGITTLRPQLSTGGNVWLGVAATGFALVALALYVAAARPARAATDADHAGAPAAGTPAAGAPAAGPGRPSVDGPPDTGYEEF